VVKKILKNNVFLKIPYITDCLSSCAAFLQAPKWSGWWCIRAVGSIMVLSYHTINSTYTSGAVFVWNIFKYFCPKTTNKFYFSWSLSCLKTFLKKHCSMISIMSLSNHLVREDLATTGVHRLRLSYYWLIVILPEVPWPKPRNLSE